MRDGQLSREWQLVRTIEANPRGIIVAEITKKKETGIRTIYRDLDALRAVGFPLYTERIERSLRSAFIGRFTSKISQNFTELNLSRKGGKPLSASCPFSGLKDE
jgi:predicted DNA-binding transcriptional regulator YafY